MKWQALLAGTACLLLLSAGCNTPRIVRIRNYDAYLSAPLGSTVKIEGCVRRYRDSNDTAMLILKNGDQMPLGGGKIIALMDGEWIEAVGIMKAKSMALLKDNRKNAGKMSLTLKYIDISKFSTARK